MAGGFSPKSTLVLYYGPQAPVRWRGYPRYLLWPVYGFRVVAPKVRPTELNVFQKAVLRLCQVARTTPADINEQLLIDVDLASLILMDLRNRDWIDQYGVITPEGEELLALERGQLADYQLAFGWVFRDPGSGRLWPRFVESLQYADVERRSSSGFPHINVGSKGRPRSVRPFMHDQPRRYKDAVPTADEIMEAVERHRTALQIGSRHDEHQHPDEHEFASVWEESGSIEKISVISTAPQPLFVTTLTYVPDSEIWHDWYACDPFLPGNSSRLLRDEIERSMESSVQLREEMERFISHALGTDGSVLSEGPADDDWIQDEIAEEQVRENLRSVALPDTLLEVLRPMERAYQDTTPSTRQDELKDVLVKAGIVLERLFGYTLQEYPANGAHAGFLRNGRAYRAELLNELALKWGFQVPIPERFSRAPARGVRAAAEGRPSTLKCQVVAALLAARSHATHPLRSAATTAPDLLETLDGAITRRNRGAHDDKGRVDLKEDVEKQIEVTYRIVRLLLGHHD